jgi:hypothetical protein
VKVLQRLFLLLAPFFVIMGVIYGFIVDWTDPVGFLGMPALGALVGMLGAYLTVTVRKVDVGAADDKQGEIAEGAGDQGVYAPWSWWPLVLGLAGAAAFLALAIGWWVFYFAGVIGIIGLVGWVFEYSRGQHAH